MTAITRQDRAQNTHTMTFTGSGKEYFGIWIMNIFLTILTLGIYSAWAKVRRKRYFYGNTKLFDKGFEYHATGKQILKSRIIAFVLYVLFNILSQVNPIFALIFMIVFIIALPSLMCSAFRFNAKMTSFGNVRFSFSGDSWDAAKAFLLGPLLAFFSLGILSPLSVKWSSHFFFDNLYYGDKRFFTEPNLKKIYAAWIMPWSIFTGTLALLIGYGFYVYYNLIKGFGSIGLDFQMMDVDWHYVALALYVGLIILYVITALIYQAAVRNVIFNATKIDNRHYLGSNVSRLSYLTIHITSFLAILFSLGFARPWAAVRMARYLATHTFISLDGTVGDVFSKIEDTSSATAGEFLEMEGIGIGF
jgi:uncharacterized membrane protein YjgN (DUF898 family)